ncbi:hypothetical protein FOL47_000929 [Perkinsus chesapeaki]|uniref:Uncharacterized protein n=1 Tax=Perkinsus chesapeaki TaxID=330153 RepID=A0A7J6N3M3_PERCH|nr:hypothetical protein FOL47_000929 [Perkinsus chesapeaki]
MKQSPTPLLYSANGFFMGLKKGGHGPSGPRRRKYTRPTVPMGDSGTRKPNRLELRAKVHGPNVKRGHEAESAAELQGKDSIIAKLQEHLAKLKAAQLGCNPRQQEHADSPNGSTLGESSNLSSNALLKLPNDVDISRLVSKTTSELGGALDHPEVVHDIVWKLAQELAFSPQAGAQESCIGCSFLSKRLRQSEETLLRCQSDAAKEILLLRRHRNLNDNSLDQFAPEALEPEFYDPLTHFDDKTRQVLQQCVEAKVEYLVGEGQAHPNVMGLLANSPRWRRQRTNDNSLAKTGLPSSASRSARVVPGRVEIPPEPKSPRKTDTPSLEGVEIQTDETASSSALVQTDDVETGKAATDAASQTESASERLTPTATVQLMSTNRVAVGPDDSPEGLHIRLHNAEESTVGKQTRNPASGEIDQVVKAENSPVLAHAEAEESHASQPNCPRSASCEASPSISEYSQEDSGASKDLQDSTSPCRADESSDNSHTDMKRHSVKSEATPRRSVRRRLIEATDGLIPTFTDAPDTPHQPDIRRQSSRVAWEPRSNMCSQGSAAAEHSDIVKADSEGITGVGDCVLSTIVTRDIIARVASKPSQRSIRRRLSDGFTAPDAVADEREPETAKALRMMSDATIQLATVAGNFVASDLDESDGSIEELQRLAAICLEYASAMGSAEAGATYQPSAERNAGPRVDDQQSASADGAPASTSSPKLFLMPPWHSSTSEKEVEALKLENEQLKDLLLELTSRGSNASPQQRGIKFPASLLKSIGPSRRWREYSAREKVFLRLYADAVSRWARGEWRAEATGDLRNSEAAKFAGIRGFIDPFSDDRGPNEFAMKILSKEAEAMALHHPWRFTADELRHPFSAREPFYSEDSASGRVRSATALGLKSKGRTLQAPASTRHQQMFDRMARTHAFSSGRSYSTSFRTRPVRPLYVKLPTVSYSYYVACSATGVPVFIQCDGTGAKDLRDIFQHTLRSCKQHTKCFREVFIRKITDEFPVLTPVQVQALAERYKSVTYPEKVNYRNFQRDVDTLKGERPKQVWACRSSDIPEAVRILFRAAFDQRVDLRELCAEAEGSPWRIAHRLNVHLSEEDAQTMMDTFGLPTAGQGFCIDPYRLHEAYKRFVWNFSHNDFRITKATEPVVQEWTPQSINVLAKSTEGVEEALTRLKHHMTAYVISPAALGDYFETNVTSAIDRMRGETATTDLFHRSLSQLLSALTQDTPLTQVDVDCLTAHFAPSYRRLCAAAAGIPTPVPQVELDALDPTSVLTKASDVQLMPHCKAFDHNRSGCVRVWDLSNILARANIHAKQSEVQALAQAFGRGDGWIDYTRMCEAAERCASDSRKWRHSG